ncbi:MAG: hypothetical protein R6W73_04780 [Candidatus Saliniplasma sp.]
MDKKKIKRILNEELDDMPWTFRYWNREDSVDIRNTGEHLTEDEVDELFDEFLEDIEKEGFKVLLEGKAGIVLEDGKFWLCGVDRTGGPGDKDKRVEGRELKEMFLKSLHRVDSGPLPSNRLSIEVDEIIDIYSESVNEERFVNINLGGNKNIVLRSDGGLHLEF